MNADLCHIVLGEADALNGFSRTSMVRIPQAAVFLSKNSAENPNPWSNRGALSPKTKRFVRSPIGNSVC